MLVPGDPDASAIYTKVTPDPPCNERMPFGGAALSDTEIACIRDFIAALRPEEVNERLAATAARAVRSSSR